MDKAKAAITDFMSKSGHHDTTVHEAVAPAVQHEVVKPHVHEEVQTAVDKEVHQDHYHRTVQPVQDREVLPEQHTAKLGAVQHREFDHRDHDTTKRNLIDEQARFKDERHVDATTHSQSAAAAIGGEHVHHHIHETIQPVVQKETIQPNVVHTTVPIHEVHHNKATHHSTTALPAMTMDEFKSKGGALTGREERYDAFEGVPKNIGAGTAGGFGAVREGSGHHDHHHVDGAPRHGDFDKSTGSGLTGHHGQQHNDFARDNRTHTTKDGLPDALTEDRSRADAHNTHTRDSTSSESAEHKKPSLMDKLNPKVDADGDGKAGFMK
ncbi:uncharacterized protein M421DRAFT_57664 [Didymella exigua CBS 183.55]|uniref:Allergen n=1 Tax=Didymella exigua CBS 183.55 TaxID=1150837 RepID=A0A6A5RTW0_9PLEO|nr:uncharacterized protein M421DRAFT_57664 [Didymella exigua CBS 183.55]KAF1930989.1 hypothetical protein M421DRAFT_57664 [Didymella exigua CBS 183.55]